MKYPLKFCMLSAIANAPRTSYHLLPHSLGSSALEHLFQPSLLDLDPGQLESGPGVHAPCVLVLLSSVDHVLSLG